MLVGPSIHSLAVSASHVAVKVGPRILYFDHDGAFRRELAVTGLPAERARLLALSDDGRLWLALSDEDDNGELKATTIAAVDESGALVLRHRLAGGWTVHVTSDDRVFVGQLEAKRLRVERLDAGSGQRTAYAQIGIEKAMRILDLDAAPAVSWAVDGQGEVFVLTTSRERGRVTRYRTNGEQVREWDVSPEPITSVSYMKELLLDRAGVPYVTHSSWEVSSAIGNHGSVLRLDLDGAPPFRIKEGIGYLQHAAVSPSEDVFLSDLSEEIHRFSSSGEHVLSWTAVPPRHGESWEERQQRASNAGRAGPSSSVADLVNAVVYGNHGLSGRAEQWLLAKGASALPEVTAAMVRLGDEYRLATTATRLWETYPEESARLFEKTRDESIRRVMAASVAYFAKPPAGVREVLSRMVLEGDERSRHALNHVGPTPQVVQANIAAFRRGEKDKDASFDAEWDLMHSYPWSIDALEAIVADPADPDRTAMRSLVLEASRELASDSHSEREPTAPIPDPVLARTRTWLTHPDPFVRATGAIALASFGVSGQELEAISAARKDRELAVDTLKAFAVLAAAHPDAVSPHIGALSLLARSARARSSYDDALTEFAKIPHPAVAEACVPLLVDESLGPERRAALLLGLKPSTLSRPVLMALLRDQTWQRSLSRQYFYYSFLDDVSEAYATDPEIRAEVRNVLLSMLSDANLDLTKHDPDKDIDARAQALETLRPLVGASDLPRVLALLDDLRFDQRSRSQVLWVLSRVPPDSELRERLIPLLEDPDMALVAAQSLGRVGYPPALGVLVEQGLKRLGYYSRVDLEIESFRPFGADGEQALLSLLDYPNDGTRALVRRFLVEWPSSDGRRRIRAEFDESIQAGRAPAGFTLAALALAGEDLVEPLLGLALAHPEAVESLADALREGPLPEQLRGAVAKESDPARIQTLHKLLKLCSCEE